MMIGKTCTCPICGQIAKYQGVNGRADKASDIGIIWYCPNCGDMYCMCGVDCPPDEFGQVCD